MSDSLWLRFGQRTITPLNSKVIKMIKLDVTDKFKKEFINQTGKYLKDGIVTFNELRFSLSRKEEFEICFYSNGDHIGTVRSENYIIGGTFHFQLLDGQMRVDVN